MFLPILLSIRSKLYYKSHNLHKKLGKNIYIRILKERHKMHLGNIIHFLEMKEKRRKNEKRDSGIINTLWIICWYCVNNTLSCNPRKRNCNLIMSIFKIYKNYMLVIWSGNPDVLFININIFNINSWYIWHFFQDSLINRKLKRTACWK